MANASKDENSVPTLIAASSTDGKTPIRVYADPDTHRLLVDSASGGVVGPVSSTDNAIVRWDGTAGTQIQNSVVTISDAGVITGATGSALTEVDDTNVTLTLGGAPSTALLTATSVTAGWTGQLAVSRGGTGASSLLSAGIPTKTSTVTATGQTADISSANLTTTGAGLYRLAYYLVDSTADLTAGAVRLNVTYTDAGAAQTQQSATVVLTILGTFTQGELIIQLASGNIAYSTTHTGAFGTATYNLYITLERLN